MTFIFDCLNVLLKGEGKVLILKMDSIFLLQHFLKLYKMVNREYFKNFALLTIEGYFFLIEVFFNNHQEGILAEFVQTERIAVVISVYDLYH